LLVIVAGNFGSGATVMARLPWAQVIHFRWPEGQHRVVSLCTTTQVRHL
jgi:hypothetical protein